MNNIPGDETLLTDNQLFEALDLNLPGLSGVIQHWLKKRWSSTSSKERR